MPYDNKKYFKGGSEESYYSTKFAEAGIYLKPGHKLPHQVQLPINTYLFRFHDGNPKRVFGEWWTTPHELYAVINYYKKYFNEEEIKENLIVKTSALGETGILHAVSAIRRDWADAASSQLTCFTLIKIKESIKIFYDEGVPATNRAKSNFKFVPEPISVDGQRWVVRQVCIPEFWLYYDKVAVVEGSGKTDSDLFMNLVNNYGSNQYNWENSLSQHYRPHILNQAQVDRLLEEYWAKAVK